MFFLFFVLLLLGPRFAIFVWWLFEPGRWESAFSSFIWPFLGFLFLPWTTLMFVAVAPFGNIGGWDWFWLFVSFLADLSTWSSNVYTNRNRIPGYA